MRSYAAQLVDFYCEVAGVTKDKLRSYVTFRHLVIRRTSSPMPTWRQKVNCIMLRRAVSQTDLSCDIEVFTDADFASCPYSAKSTSGIIIMLRTGESYFPVHWLSRKQSSTARSTTEAEMIALATPMFSETENLQTFLEVLLDAAVSVSYQQDNETVLAVLKAGYSAKLRHMNRVHRVNVASVCERFVRQQRRDHTFTAVALFRGQQTELDSDKWNEPDSYNLAQCPQYNRNLPGRILHLPALFKPSRKHCTVPWRHVDALAALICGYQYFLIFMWCVGKFVVDAVMRSPRRDSEDRSESPSLSQGVQEGAVPAPGETTSWSQQVLPCEDAWQKKIGLLRSAAVVASPEQGQQVETERMLSLIDMPVTAYKGSNQKRTEAHDVSDRQKGNPLGDFQQRVYEAGLVCLASGIVINFLAVHFWFRRKFLVSMPWYEYHKHGLGLHVIFLLMYANPQACFLFTCRLFDVDLFNIHFGTPSKMNEVLSRIGSLSLLSDTPLLLLKALVYFLDATGVQAPKVTRVSMGVTVIHLALAPSSVVFNRCAAVPKVKGPETHAMDRHGDPSSGNGLPDAELGCEEPLEEFFDALQEDVERATLETCQSSGSSFVTPVLRPRPSPGDVRAVKAEDALSEWELEALDAPVKAQRAHPALNWGRVVQPVILCKDCLRFRNLGS
ncbi:unnamed protein product [Symbiodinium sp. CCMP2592]|nr:unnamed protein product [Symbiodinium sp. CCMP2592]